MENETLCDKCRGLIDGEMKITEELGEIIISHKVCPTNMFIIKKSVIIGGG